MQQINLITRRGFLDRSMKAEHRAMGATTTRMVDFKPHAFAPSAFADWADAPATAR